MKTAIVHAQQKWEHQAISRRSDAMLVEEMNELGEHGWHMVSALYYTDAKGAMTWTAFLRRPKFAPSGKAPAGGAAAEAAYPIPAKPQQAEAGPAGFDLSGEVFEVKTT
jgi:hypothetical protein